MGSFRFLFFLFLLSSPDDEEEWAGGRPLQCRQAAHSASVSGRSITDNAVDHLHPPLLPLLLRLLLLLPSGLQRRSLRKRREEESTASPAAPARDGKQTPEERRKLRSLLCGAGSARLPGRTPGEEPSVAVARRSFRVPPSFPRWSSCVPVGLRTARAHITTVLQWRHHARKRLSRRRRAEPSPQPTHAPSMGAR